MIYADINLEIDRARRKHPKPYQSAHEAYGILAEEFAEFFDEVRRKEHNKAAMREELVQIATVAIRAIEDLGLDPMLNG